MKEDKEVCMEAGMNAYLSKPVSIELLKEELSKAAREIKGERSFHVE